MYSKTYWSLALLKKIANVEHYLRYKYEIWIIKWLKKENIFDTLKQINRRKSLTWQLSLSLSLYYTHTF